MRELSPEHQQVRDDFVERIRLRVAGALGTPALWLAEQVGKHYEPPHDYPDEDYED